MTRAFLAFALALGAFVVTAAGGHAAVPSNTIKAWQDSAPEALEVTILSVREERQAQAVPGQPNCTQTRYEFTITAKVDVVRRSASGVRPGRTITLHDSALRTGPCALPGGSFGEILNGGDRAAAYLRPAGTPDGAFMAVYLERLR